MSKAFRDHFAGVAGHYASSRPGYPAELILWLAEQCKGHALCWDCATGSGQAALDLVGYFRQVVATDASAAQLAEAAEHPRISFRQAPAENSGLADASVDLVVVAQALHWFDVPAFHAEARRVLKPGGLIAEWCYGVQALEGDGPNRLLQHFYHEVVGPYWPAERRHVENGYAELAFPFPSIEVPPFAMRQHWNLAQLLGYLRSWSASGRCLQASGTDPVAALETELAPLWALPEQTREVVWPLTVRVGCKES